MCQWQGEIALPFSANRRTKGAGENVSYVKKVFFVPNVRVQFLFNLNLH